MPSWLDVDWDRVFVPSQPILETIVRGTVTYLALFIMLRLFRRQTGSLGPADLLVLLLIADASQNAMADEYKSVTDGLILVSTIIGWEFALDWLSYHFPSLGKVIDRPALQVIKNGQVEHAHLKRELMTLDELMSQLRQKGVDDFSKVKLSFIEGDGRVSVVTYDPSQTQKSDERDPSSGR